MKTVQIHDRWTGKLLYETQVADGDRFPIRTALKGAYLEGAYLEGAYWDRKSFNAAVPPVKDLDAKILAAVESGEGSLNMSNWHTCETTHCRAGWAITLAGQKGKELEIKHGPATAGALIYWRSTGRVPNFYAGDEEALADIVACAHDQGGAP